MTGTLERMDEMGDGAYDDLRDDVRRQYCRTAGDGEAFGSASSERSSTRPPDGDFDLGEHEEL